MPATMLAKAVGMDYAYVCGHDIITAGEEGVCQIQILFAWAKLCADTGLLLCIDNADAFLSKGVSLMNDDKTASDINILGAFIHSMESLPKNVLLVLALNQ